MKYYACLLACVFIFTTSNVFAGNLVPNTFTNGETISSSKMNDNFTSLEGAVNTAITNVSITQRSNGSSHNISNNMGSEVVTQTCATDEILFGGTCSCFHSNNDSTTTNFGVLAYCDIVGNAILGTCFSEALTYSSFKYGPAVTVNASCVARVTVADGTTSPAASLKSLASVQAQEIQDLNQEALNGVQQLKKLTQEREQMIK